MNKNDLLKNIAETGYNIGFGAKKHFSTFDIVHKLPGLIGFLSMVFGIYTLVFKSLSTDFLSATFTIFGVMSIYISLYEHKKDQYEVKAIELTKLYNQLSKLYRNVKDSNTMDLTIFINELQEIETSYYSTNDSKQILFSDWYAHYKFFWQHQIDWIDEQKHFKLLRDKIPLNFTIFILSIIILSIYYLQDAKVLFCQK